ncbi:MAG TPA: ThuA domain-containing protein [Phycisphaerales bacterium]|nr:ThuA domain-containing protein [Phycisphaerales bacterium]
MNENNWRQVRDGTHWTRRRFLQTATAAGAAMAIPLGRLNAQGTDEEQRIEAAVSKLVAVPGKSRRLLIFDRNVGYGGHPSARTANQAFTRMGRTTGAFEAVVSQDPAVFAPESLRRFDAVFFNNNVGNLFTDPLLRRSLVEFVYGGGGLMGVHGTSVAFTQWPGAIEDWPEFGIMLGARGANHRESTERVFLRVDDPTHPVVRSLPGGGFEYRDEFFRFGDPYSRRRVRVLLSIDTEKTDLDQGPARGQCLREDGDYALAWVRGYGRGRVFYCTIAHNPYVFWDPMMLQFYLAATQFILGDLPGPTTPSAFLTPAVRARERLGWATALVPNGRSSPPATLFETIDRAAEAGLLNVGAVYGQPVRPGDAARLDASLAPELREAIRLKLDAAAVCLRTLRIDHVPDAAADLEQLFDVARQMGAETLIVPAAARMDPLESLCRRHDIHVALVPPDSGGTGGVSGVAELLAACAERDQRLGVCVSPRDLRAVDADPAQAVGWIGGRLKVLRLGRRPSARGRLNQVLAAVAKAGMPLLIGVNDAVEPQGAAAMREHIDRIDETCIELADKTR